MDLRPRHMGSLTPGLESLPVELLYEVQLFALSEHLPLISHHFYNVFKQASPFFHARYILGRAQCAHPDFMAHAYTKALRYPICNQKVVQAMGTLMKHPSVNDTHVILPRRLFRSLQPPQSGWSDEDEPLPLIRYLYQNSNIPPINTNSHGGYALTRAVHSKFLPLVHFLLDHKASPKCGNNLAVEVAIRQKDLTMVKLLVERPQVRTNGKRRRTEDRVQLDSKALKIAVKMKAQDIIEYLHCEKRVIPDVHTLKKLTCL